jgi:hypothetical protein
MPGRRLGKDVPVPLPSKYPEELFGDAVEFAISSQ